MEKLNAAREEYLQAMENLNKLTHEVAASKQLHKTKVSDMKEASDTLIKLKTKLFDVVLKGEESGEV